MPKTGRKASKTTSFIFLVLFMINNVAVAVEGAPEFYIRMPSGILVRADSWHLYVSVSNDTKRPPNAFKTFLIFTAPNNYPTLQTYVEPEIVFAIDRMSYGVQLCYELISAIGSKEHVSQKCATEFPEWIHIEKVFQLDTPTVSYSLAANKVELTCHVSPPDNDILSQLSIVYEIQLECLSHNDVPKPADRGCLLQPRTVRDTCNAVFDNLDTSTSYRATVRAFLNESSLKSAPGSVEFATPQTPPGSNPSIVGYDKMDGRVFLLLERPSRATSFIGLRVDAVSCLDEDRQLAESFSDFSQQTTRHANCSTSTVILASKPTYQTVVRLPSQSVGSFQVEVVGQNAAGWSTAAANRALISDVKSGSYSLWATVEEIVPILLLEKTVLCWSATIHFGIQIQRNVTIGSGTECVRQLVIDSNLLPSDQSDMADGTSGISVWNDVGESVDVQVQLDWVRCERESEKCAEVLQNGRQRSKLKMLNGTLELAKVGVSEQIGLAVTIYSKNGREVYRTPMEYGQRCTFRDVRKVNGSLEHTLPIVDVDLDLNGAASVLLPVNSCSRLLASDWFLEYEVQLKCENYATVCALKNTQRLKHIPGYKPIGIVPCKAGNCHGITFDGLSAGTTYKLEITGRTLDGRVVFLHAQRLHVGGLNVAYVWILVSFAIFLTTFLCVSAVIYQCIRQTRKHDGKRCARGSVTDQIVAQSPEKRDTSTGELLTINDY